MTAESLCQVAEVNPRGQRVGLDEQISFVGMAQLDAEHATATPLASRVFSEVAKGYTVFKNGDILVAKITPCWENGKIGQAKLQHLIGVGSTEFHVVRPGEFLDARYVLHFLRQRQVKAEGELRMTGSGGQRRVPVAFLRELKIPFPSIAEQRRIAAILDHADALRAKRRQVLAHLDALSKSIFHESFGNPLTNSHGLPRVALGSACQVMTGNSPSRAEPANFGTEIEWIKSDNLGGEVASVAQEWLSERGLRRARVAPTGSILVTCIAGSRSSIGKASLVDRDVAFNQQINAILPSSDVNKTFLLAQLKAAPELISDKSTNGMKGLVNKSSFESVRIVLPSVEAQREFESCVSRISLQQRLSKRALIADDELFASLQSRAFRGEL